MCASPICPPERHQHTLAASFPCAGDEKVDRYVHGAGIEDTIVLNKEAQPSSLKAQGHDQSTSQGIGSWGSYSVKPLSSSMSTLVSVDFP